MSTIKMIARSNKKTWSRDEDLKLMNLVDEHGANNWTLIATELGGGKRSKQCRERYHNHLQADIKKGGWTEEEEQLIFELQATYGNQWAKIASHFPGRTDNAIKNRYNSMMRSLQHKQMKQLRQSEQQRPSDTTSLSSASSTTSSGVLYSMPAMGPSKRHPLVPALSLGVAKSQQPQSQYQAAALTQANVHIQSTPLTISTILSARSSSSSSNGFPLSPYNFASSRSLLDMAQFRLDGDVLETFRSTSSFDILRAILDDSEGESSSDDEDDLDMIPDTIVPFSAREEIDWTESTVAPFSSRVGEEVAEEEVILSPWWEERDALFDLGSVMKRIEISPRQTTIPMRMTPRSPFMMNMKKQRRGVY